MAYQRDPERIVPVPEDEIVRRENIERRDEEIARANAEATNSTGFFPIILTVLIVLGVGYFAYSYMYPRTVVDAPRTSEYSAPRSVIPAPAPATPAPAPVAPETK